ncbi:alpha/beta fold hydrolase [Desulfovibrio mangrovi]|uniref:YheT family hydrolase n=1 Tax=Desulfovibrio mangrovi TaxID=2976983 RepID=UPI0022467F27|nr:alpha/beta fold hydrolase [Desulfovibrio mangrovi]UZP68652.1 alpha/beta fold hydrolase [Desulfovibrio mangrovi]
MPLLPTPSYTTSLLLSNGHVQTLYPPLFRKVAILDAERVRIATHDDDFLDLDFLPATAEAACPNADGVRARPLVIISHGLEGHSRRKYVRGMAACMNAAGWDVCAWNFRGCSGETNRALRMYHSGVTDDLHTVISYCAERGYARIALAGFSMGGNQILKYLGEHPAAVHPAIVAAATFSVPCDLVGAAKVLDRPSNSIYMRYFMRSLKEKMRKKKELHPELNIEGLDDMKTFAEFDNQFTAPIHGFRDAMDYWQRCGCGQFLSALRVPALLVNAKNDPFLSPTCYPVYTARASEFLHLEMPVTGGHVGFIRNHEDGCYWSDLRAVEFLRQHL